MSETTEAVLQVSLLDRVIRRQTWMDGVAQAIQRATGAVYGSLGDPGRTLRDLMHGTNVLRHPLHPAITDVPLGAWTVGVIADWLALITGRVTYQVGDIGLGIGFLAALLAVVSGYTDFHDTYAHERRMALTHGLTMTGVVGLDAVSLAIRIWGGSAAHLPAVFIASFAFLVALAAAYIGGDLTFGLGTMVNRSAFAEGPMEFVAVGKPEDFREGQMRRVDAGGMPAVVVRSNGALCAIAAVCSHAGGPLDEGKLEHGIVTCPWHGSRFSICTGRVHTGPATFNQPAFLVRERDGEIEVRLAHPLH